MKIPPGNELWERLLRTSPHSARELARLHAVDIAGDEQFGRCVTRAELALDSMWDWVDTEDKEEQLSHHGRKLTSGEYTGLAEYSGADKVFHGRLEGIRDLVTFESTTISGLRQSFEDAVAVYRQEKDWSRR